MLISFVEGGNMAGLPTAILVETDHQKAISYSRSLRSGGFEILVADTAEDALALCMDPAMRIDLVIARALLPGMTGPEMVRALRETCKTPVLLLSAYKRDVISVVRGFSRDMNILEDPFTAEDLVHRAQIALRRYRTAQEY